jgi:hypothetical protein
LWEVSHDATVDERQPGANGADMAASVRIEDEAFADARIEMLGSLAGFNRYEALGRMAHLWRVCTLRETYTLDPVWIDACLGPKGHEHLVTAGLGERVDGGIRIRGTSGRIEWLGQRRQAAKKGGAATKGRKAAGPGPEVGQEGAKREPSASQVASQAATQEEAKPEPNGSPLTLTPCLLSEDSPKPPEGGVIRPTGPEPPEVVAHWNAQPNLTPATATDSFRDRVIRSWQFGRPEWDAAWREVFEYLNAQRWRQPLSWVFKDSNYLSVYEQMRRDRPKPLRYTNWRAAEQNGPGMMPDPKPRKDSNDNRAA